MAGLSHSAFMEIEDSLSSPTFMGVPLGCTLSHLLMVLFLGGHADWSLRRRVLNQGLMARHWLFPRRARSPMPHITKGQVVVAWLHASSRLNELVIPVLHAIGENACTIVGGNDADAIAAIRPAGTNFVAWRELQRYDMRAWRAEYARSAPLWETKIRALCQKHCLPTGTVKVLSLALMVASQWVAGAIESLKQIEPSIIVTDADRAHMWSCLVLAARRSGIPTLTLTHGIMREDALGYAPVLADIIACWGELDRAKLLRAGEPPEKVIAAGCPRLTRELPLSRCDARLRLGLDPEMPVVLFASTPEAERLKYLKLFCQAAEKLEGITGMVRLHPSERLKDYAEVMACHPAVRFMDNRASSLDESLAAVDVVVVHGTGVGSDALVKRRLAVLLDSDAVPTGICSELAHQAGCPHARNSDELARLLCKILDDEQYRADLTQTAEKYVDRFCVAFGVESAQRIADIVKQEMGKAERPSSKARASGNENSAMQSAGPAHA